MPITLIDTKSDEFAHQTLRFATLDDVDWIVQNGIQEFKDSPYFDFGVDQRKTRALFERLIADGQNDAVVLISHDAGSPVGVLAAYAFQPLFSRSKIAIECLWFLTESNRKGSRGHDMMKAYEYWARLVGCSHVQYGLLTTSPERMEILYRKTGATETERIFTKVLS